MRVVATWLMLVSAVTAQAPALIKVAAVNADQLKVIATEQQKLVQQINPLVQAFNNLELQKANVKLRACMDAKVDVAGCDAMELALDGESWVLRIKPKEIVK